MTSISFELLRVRHTNRKAAGEMSEVDADDIVYCVKAQDTLAEIGRKND